MRPPPQTSIADPMQTADVSRGVGAPSVESGLHDLPSKRAPVLRNFVEVSACPPQIIIPSSLQTAECRYLAPPVRSGSGDQLLSSGLKALPLFRASSPKPPQMI